MAERVGEYGQPAPGALPDGQVEASAGRLARSFLARGAARCTVRLLCARASDALTAPSHLVLEALRAERPELLRRPPLLDLLRNAGAEAHVLACRRATEAKVDAPGVRPSGEALGPVALGHGASWRTLGPGGCAADDHGHRDTCDEGSRWRTNHVCPTCQDPLEPRAFSSPRSSSPAGQEPRPLAVSWAAPGSPMPDATAQAALSSEGDGHAVCESNGRRSPARILMRCPC